ncbi:MAG: Flp pilus assembly protein CpaB [Propionibacteriaceae bacterium]
MTKLFSFPARFLRRHRRAIAALLAGLSVYYLSLSLHPPATPTRSVIVAAHDLAGGTTVQASDLITIELPSNSAPPSATNEIASLTGKVLAAPVAAGIPITQTSILSPAFIAMNPGHVLTPLRLSDPESGTLLTAGSFISVVSASEGHAETIVDSARVAAIPHLSESAGGAFSNSDSDSRGLLIILDVTPDQAAALAEAETRGKITIALRQSPNK